MDDKEEKIRTRAYEIWERQGHSGSPDDHWFEGERELKAEGQPRETSADRSEATVEEAPPVEAVEALEAASGSPAKGKRSPRSSKG
ncbi:DUF2934 domain-containing protein [Microvirga pakistanensis]|uniref:DUF2934 domain-containing protein n=1 Tax=Microvirga pakistanensis TaxID=1682650 RepID=UPI001FCEF8BC|nr:DUF2934 domain-containing protein [Microvirga pakistanensis]